MHYTIQNINVWSAFKFSSVIGCILGFFPGLTISLTLRSVINSLLGWLQSWLVLDVPLVGSYSLLDAVNLQNFLSQLQRWDRRSWLLVLLLTLLSMVIGGLVTGLLSALGAAIYNLVAAFSGGIVVQADTLDNALFAIEPVTPALSPSLPPIQGSGYPPVSLPSAPPAKRSHDEGVGGWLIAQATQQHFFIGREETCIGSGPNNQIVLVGLAVNHAAIRWENGRFILYDYSGGQTWVNGRALVGPNMIKEGFQIRLGNQEFLFQA